MSRQGQFLRPNCLSWNRGTAYFASRAVRPLTRDCRWPIPCDSCAARLPKGPFVERSRRPRRCRSGPSVPACAAWLRLRAVFRCFAGRFEKTCAWRWATICPFKGAPIFPAHGLVPLQFTGNIPSRIGATPVLDEVKFDRIGQRARRCCRRRTRRRPLRPHWSGHEIMAADHRRRHPIVMLVRQASTPERASRKLKWYRALERGNRAAAEAVPRRSRTRSAYLKVLKSGKILAITPDILADPEQGVETPIFGRPARLNGGAFALAIAAGAPLIRACGRWQSTSSVSLMFDRAPPPPDSDDREAAIRAAVQDWCQWFEEKLRANPENWQFWLDKRWSRFLRATPRACLVRDEHPRHAGGHRLRPVSPLDGSEFRA